MATTISLFNRKGGAAKTSTTHHLGGTLAKMGRRVLLVDKDPQGSLTQGLTGPVEFEGLAVAETVVEIYEGNFPHPSQVIRPTAMAGLDLLPAHYEELDPYNEPKHWLQPDDLMGCLRDFLGQVAGDYDYILIDCPPNLYTCSHVALVASDFVLVPLQAEDYGAQGLKPVQRSIEVVRARANPGLEVLGYLVTQFNKSLGIHQGYDQQLRLLYPGLVFANQFPLAKDFKEAVAARQMIHDYKPKSASAKAVRAIAEEMEDRLSARRGESAGVERSNPVPMAEVA